MESDGKHSMVVKVTADDLAKVHALAGDAGETISVVVRGWLRSAYRARFGEAPPPTPKLKHDGKPKKR